MAIIQDEVHSMAEFLATDPEVSGSIPGPTAFFEK
jgi:hypothetical protein